ncbi:MAG TPA: hypothetical protein VL527_16385, partial [Dongiaceae bacterium]|nr:hypothetical protein [Dongiaceae bacterium]
MPQKIGFTIKPHGFRERVRMFAGMRKSATSAGLRAESKACRLALGSAPASGVVFRALAENPERPKSSQCWEPGPRATAGRVGAAGYARGGRAPQLTPVIQPNQTGSNHFYIIQGSANRRPIPQSELRIPKWRITKRTQFFWHQSNSELIMVKSLTTISGGKPNWVRLAS